MSDSNYNNMAWLWTALVSVKFYIQLNPIMSSATWKSSFRNLTCSRRDIEEFEVTKGQSESIRKLKDRQHNDKKNNMAWLWTALVSVKFYIQLNPIITIIMATLAHDDRGHIRNNYFIFRN
jgi:hypothetical protein